MKKRLLNLVLIAICTLLLCSSRSSNPIDSYGRYKGVYLYGNVYVSTDPDDTSVFRAYVRDLPQDAHLYVYFTDSEPNRRPGHWTVVRDRRDADFCVYLMASFQKDYLHINEDFNIYVVDEWLEAGVNPAR